MTDVVDYMIIEGTTRHVREEVMGLLAKGWELSGSGYGGGHMGVTHFQPMILKAMPQEGYADRTPTQGPFK